VHISRHMTVLRFPEQPKAIPADDAELYHLDIHKEWVNANLWKQTFDFRANDTIDPSTDVPPWVKVDDSKQDSSDSPV